MTSEKLHIVPKGWGFEKWITNNEKYCGKLLYFIKDRKCSFHLHKLKEEHFYLFSGKLVIYHGFDHDKKLASITVMEPGDVFHVPIGLVHQMHALQDSQLFEFSTQHFDEDSYRIEKGD